MSTESNNDASPSNDEQQSEDAYDNPFSQENVGYLLFVQLSRLYDVNMALLTAENPTAANRLLEAHANGDILGANPFFSGRFYSDMQQQSSDMQQESSESDEDNN